MRQGLVVLRAGFLALTLFGVSEVSAQNVSGTMTGFVFDASNAPVPNAKVVGTNVQTGVATTRLTDNDGLYLITNLPPGTYSLAVEAPGFQRFVQENIQLKVDFRFNLDVHLVLGDVTQEINVTAAPPMLKTEQTDVSLELPQRMVDELPTLGRNVSRLHFLAPGTVRMRGQDTWFQNENPTLGATAITNGRFWGDNDYLLDGITNVEYGITGMQIINPNQDSVQEVKLTTSDYSAEFGGIGGLVAQYVTKSGTNQLHGSLFWFNRNKAFFAADPFTEKVPGTGKDGHGTGPAPFNWNQQGFSLGGPIKKNKMFFFGDYQATRIRQGGSILTTYPVADFQNGDLRRALGNPIVDSQGRPVAVQTTEGATVQARQNMIFDPTTGNADGTGRRAFSCGGQVNVICPNRFNPVTVNLLALLNRESAQLPVNQSLLQNNLAASGSSLFNQDQFDARYDASLNDQNKIFTRYTYFKSRQENPPLFGLAGGPGFAGGTPNIGDFANHHAVINYTRSWSPTLLTEARIGFARFGLNSLQWDSDQLTNDEVGIKGINFAGDRVTQGLAAFRIDGPTGAFNMGFGTDTAIPRFDFNTIFQYETNWTKIKSSHELRWGATVIRQRSDFNSINESTRGDFSFNRLLTAAADAPGTGLGMASFLLGTPSAFVRGKINLIATDRVWRLGYYFRDSWRVTPKLTINYGLRWDFIGRPHPRNRAENANYDPNTNNLLLACLGQVSCTSNVDNDLNDFAPRLGIAYKLFSHTVIRAGYGRSYFASNFGAHLGTLGVNFPMQVRQNITQTSQFFSFPNPATGQPFTLDQTVPPVPPLQIPDSGLLQLPPGLNVWTVPKDTRTSYLDTWNFTVQHQLQSDLSISVGYVGNVGRKLYDNININAPIPGPGPLNPRQKYFNLTGNAGPINLRCHCSSSSYNSLLIQLEKRFSMGYSMTANYTWAKALDIQYGGFGWAGQDQNPFDRRASRGISEYNHASAFTLGHVWELPYGANRRFGSSAPAVAKAVLGGWAFNGVTTVYSGYPISITWGDTSSLNSNFGQRPDLVGDPHVDNPSRNLWYNPKAFANPQPYHWGNYGRNGGDLRGPGFFEADWSLWKTFKFRSPLSEATGLEIRWETFNLFNNTNLDTPVNQADSAIAGQITAIVGTMRRMQFGARMTW